MERGTLKRNCTWGLILAVILAAVGASNAQESEKGKTSYAPVDIKEDFATTMARMKAAKPEVMKRQMDLLKERYDMSSRPATGVTMSRGKSVQ